MSIKFFYVLPIVLFVSCSQNKKNTTVDSEDSIPTHLRKPPPPPPLKGDLWQTTTLYFDYGSDKPPVHLNFFADKLIQYMGNSVQTYQLTSSSTFGKDTFYLALPFQKNHYWSRLVLKPSKDSRICLIGYEESENFYAIYRVSLGSDLNKGSVYLAAVDEKK
ncbi:MAG: hypothetical protein RL660_1788 [Bacteroidota bacterium]|jgi:hypothetical protein